MLGRRDKVKVLYIAGWGRSGSTILDNVLGQIEGFFSVGEINYVWERNVIENRLCGCGLPFRQCGVWPGIFYEAYGGIDRVDAREMIQLRDGGLRIRHVPLLFSTRGRRLLGTRLKPLAARLGRLYETIRASGENRVIVDSSKTPLYGYELAMTPEADLYVVHLVRDPRAVAYSWLRKKFQSDTGAYMPRYGAVESALAWSAWNLLTEPFRRLCPDRYLRLRYEYLVEEPREAVVRILDLLGEEPPDLPFGKQREVELQTNHTVGGNPSRFRTGRVELRLDEEWRSGMKPADKSLVTALTWPLLLRYRYLGLPNKGRS